MAVFRNQDDAGLHRIRDSGDVKLFAAKDNLSCKRWSASGKRFEQLRSPRSEQAVDAKDLSPVQCEAQIM